MDNVNLVLEGASAVLLAGLVFGAGLPVVYAVALRVLTIGATLTPTSPSTAPRASPAACSRACSSRSSWPASRSAC